MVSSRCESCHGRTFILGLGGMQKKCVICDGTGYTRPLEQLAEVIKRKRRTPAEMAADKVKEG